jgi:general stress protein 26
MPQSPMVPASQATLVGTPQIADDADLIEKEWVEKAKEIVEQTKHDPYLQNKEITKVKADYMKKRYNKDIKLED